MRHRGEPRRRRGIAAWLAGKAMASLTAMREAVRRVAAVPAVRGVIFDLDGTLVDTEPLYRRAFEAALAAFGRAIDQPAYGALIGLATPDRMALLTQRFGADFPCDAFKAEYNRQKQRHLADAAPLKPGAGQLLDLLNARGIPVALATAASAASTLPLLQRLEIHQRFGAVVTRDDVSRRKPHPDPFLHAARLLLADPAECIVLEDSAPGIEAAHAAGAIPVLIPDLAAVPAHIRRK